MGKTDEIEIWKPCAGFSKYYEVSSQGSIRRLARSNTVTYKNRVQRKNDKSTKGVWYTVNLSVNGKVLTKDVHKLIGATFLRYGRLRVIRHINGNTLDNRLSNLECVTHSQKAEKCKSYKNFHRKKKNVNAQAY